MIVRVWRGWTALADADTYVRYVESTGISAYRETPGNRGAWILTRPAGEQVEVVTVSVWDSRDAIRAFAGDDIDLAVFYPEDDRFLVRREHTVRHYEVRDAAT